MGDRYIAEWCNAREMLAGIRPGKMGRPGEGMRGHMVDGNKLHYFLTLRFILENVRLYEMVVSTRDRSFDKTGTKLGRVSALDG